MALGEARRVTDHSSEPGRNNLYRTPALCGHVFEQLPGHLVGRARLIRFVLAEQFFPGGALAFCLALPEHGERRVERDEQTQRVEEVAEVGDDALRRLSRW
jgi:hypothetical protein